MTEKVMPHRHESVAALQQLRQMMLEHGDPEHAGKVEQLIGKLAAEKCSLAFCGHFSAGKSSLINALCGSPILPSGPVPTSANQVTIEFGEPVATVFLKRPSGDGEDEVDIKIEDVRTFGMNGRECARIQIRYPSPLLADRLQFIDTPGIDSTDETHQAATDSSIHLADAVFFVTDYNHVLSELNFAFMKRLQDWHKPLYLVVNQVDKHDDREMAFRDFRQHIEETLAARGVRTSGLLFISVKYPGHPLSDWNKLLWLIGKLGESSGELLGRSVLHSAAILADAHVDSLYPSDAADDSEEARTLERSDVSSATDRLTEIERMCEAMAAELEQTRRLPEREREAFRKDAGKLVENAILMPATLREAAERYLESRKPGFKVGLFLSGARTEQERADRLSRLSEQFRERTEQHLIWFLNELLVKYARKHGMTEDQIAAGVATVAADPGPEWIAAQVNDAAGFNREYTMTFAAALSDRIKLAVRKQAMERFARIEERIAHGCEAAAADLEHRLREMEQEAIRLRRERELEEKRRSYRASLPNIRVVSRQERAVPDPADVPDPSLPTGEPAATADMSAAAVLRPVAGGPAVIGAAVQSGTSRPDNEPAVSFDPPTAGATPEPAAGREPSPMAAEAARMARMLEDAAEALAGIASFEPLRRSLADKARRMKRHRFTVALFGAFSAGKSSLANALLGAPVLPVSPNPTTAAINTILPPETDWPHLTARVRMKSREAVLDDIRYSLSMLGLDTAGLTTPEAALAAIGKLDTGGIPPRGKPHAAFLQAVLLGWPGAVERIGREWRADAAQYREYVANEHKSCFVERVDLHYASALSEQGVVLVDTPGADSIHARHTGVSFNYIKNADAILFVTYYNHAFSQADKQFLDQLGRVKDRFALDKMLFIVNAADLADSREELSGVLRHVEEQLAGHGIRSARIFPVSSRMALRGKTTGDDELVALSGMPSFERAFTVFASGELHRTAIRSGETEIGRVAGELRRLISLARRDERELREQAERMREAVAELAGMLDGHASGLRTDPLRQEIRELLHYAWQRCMYRFGDWYNDAFHPSVLQQGGGNMQAALNAAWRHLLQIVSVEISQETLATSLRIERFIQLQCERIAEGWRSAAAERLPGFEAEMPPPRPLSTPEVAENLEEAEPREKTMRRRFRSARSFFEGGGKSELRADLEGTVAAALREYVRRHEHLLIGHYVPLYEACVREAGEKFKAQMNFFLTGYEEGRPRDVGDLENRLARISRLSASFARESTDI